MDTDAPDRSDEIPPTLTRRLADWASSLTFDDLPDDVIDFCRSQVLSQLAAARATLDHPLGDRISRVFGTPTDPDPHRRAVSLAALTMALDYDDTIYAGHVTHSSVNVPLAYGAAHGLDGRRLVAAIVTAGECAARVTVAATLGPHRGQTAAHAHLVGAPAGRLHAAGLSASAWVNAWGLALTAPPWSLHRGFLGSDAKVFTAAVPVDTGLRAVDGAEAGLVGAPDIIEAPDGFLARFADVPLPEAVVDGLGKRWHTTTTSFKVYPGCAYLDAAIDAAVAIHHRLGSGEAARIESVIVAAGILTVVVDMRAAAYVEGPASPVAALNFSVAYSVATALLTGGLTHADFAAPLVADPRRWGLVERIRVEHDEEITRRSLLATAPLGEALRFAGPDRAREWLVAHGGEQAASIVEDLGRPVSDFDHADKAVGARVVVTMDDGRTLIESVDIAKGAIGSTSGPDHGELMRDKFLSCGGSPRVADDIAYLEDMSSEQVARLVERALS